MLTMVMPACISMSSYTPPSGVALSSIKVTMASNSSLTNALRVFIDIFNPAIKEYLDYPAAMRIGVREQFVAVGTYSDTAYSAITSQVSWSSSNPAVATISTGGLVSAVSDGTTNITATLSGIASQPLVLTVGSPNSTSSSDLSIAKFAPVSVSSRIADNKGIDYSTRPNRN